MKRKSPDRSRQPLGRDSRVENAPKTLQPEARNWTRREVLGALGAFTGAVLTKAFWPSEEQKPTMEATGNPERSILPDSYEIVKKPVHFEVPAGYDEESLNSAVSKVMPELESLYKADNFAVQPNQIAEIAKKYIPEITVSEDPKAMLRDINRYFNPAGYYFVPGVSFVTPTEYGITLTVHKIEGSKQIEVSDEEKPYPVLEISSDLFREDEYKFLFGHVDAIREDQMILIFPHKFRPAMELTVKGLEKNFDVSDFDLKKELEAHRNDVIFHELIHARLDNLFPEASSTERILTEIKGWSFKIDLGHSTTSPAEFSGTYTPAMFHELVAFGAELIKGTVRSPLQTLKLLSMSSFKEKAPDAYKLLLDVVPYAIMKESADNQEWLELARKLNSGKGIALDIAKFVWDEKNFDKEAEKRIGHMLLTLGFQFIKEAERQIKESRGAQKNNN